MSLYFRQTRYKIKKLNCTLPLGSDANYPWCDAQAWPETFPVDPDACWVAQRIEQIDDVRKRFDVTIVPARDKCYRPWILLHEHEPYSGIPILLLEPIEQTVNVTLAPSSGHTRSGLQFCKGERLVELQYAVHKEFQTEAALSVWASRHFQDQSHSLAFLLRENVPCTHDGGVLRFLYGPGTGVVHYGRIQRSKNNTVVKRILARKSNVNKTERLAFFTNLQCYICEDD